MSAEHELSPDDAGALLAALTDRVDALAGMVRRATTGETTTGASEFERRLRELVGQGPEDVGVDLVALRGELDALRGFVADRSSRPEHIAAASSHPLRETIAELACRLDLLGDGIRSASGRVDGETEAASGDPLGDEEARARFAEIQRGLAALGRRPATASGSQLEQLGDDARARAAVMLESIRRQVEVWGDDLEIDAAVCERITGLVDGIEALGSHVGTLAGIADATRACVGWRQDELVALDCRIDHASLRLEDLAGELRSTVSAAEVPDGQSDVADAHLRANTLTSGLESAESDLAETSAATEQLGLDLRHAIGALAAGVVQEHDHAADATDALEQRRAALEARMDSLAAFASSSAALGSEEVEALAAAVVRRHAEVLEVTAEWEARRVDLARRIEDLTTFAASTPAPDATETGTLDGRTARAEREAEGVHNGKPVADPTSSSDVTERLDELARRLDELTAIVMAQQTGSASSLTGVPVIETPSILSRLDEADRLRAQSREKVLEQMERIAARMDWRLQRLEAAGANVTVGVDDA